MIPDPPTYVLLEGPAFYFSLLVCKCKYNADSYGTVVGQQKGGPYCHPSIANANTMDTRRCRGDSEAG
jgi:hypothetical protein